MIRQRTIKKDARSSATNGIQFEFDADRREAELKAEKKRKRRRYFRSISG